MKILELKARLQGADYEQTFAKLYDDVDSAKARYSDACDEFIKLFGDDREAEFFSSPGRTEVGGNHTDHQLGRVLAGSVNLDVIGVVSPNNDGVVRIKSAGFNMDVVSLNDLNPAANEEEHAIALIRGTCARMKSLGYQIGGFDAYTTSNVLKGSGLSSSAAFEVLVGTILSHLFNNGAIDPITIAMVAQYAENEFFGKPCGLMDQMACSVGGFTAIDFADPEKPTVEKVQFDLSSRDYCLCIVNTGGNHADLTTEYAAVPGEMSRIAKFFGKSVLRQVDPEAFYQKIAELRLVFGDRAVLRAIHFFDENDRALQEKEALRNGEFDRFLNLVNESGRSSYMKLQNVYSSQNVAEQGLSLALALSEHILADRGAWRVHGGGFGGTIQAFVPTDLLETYRKKMEAVFGKDTCYVLKIRPFGGVRVTDAEL